MSKKKGDGTPQSLGGKARAESYSPEERSAMARKGGIQKALNKLPKATHRGSFKEEFGIDADCYVLDDDKSTAVISKRGMSEALGMGKGATVFMTFISGKRLVPYVGIEVAEKIANPLIFQALDSGGKLLPTPAHGYDVTMLIDVCKAVLSAAAAGKIDGHKYRHIVAQAHVVLNASAKAGITNLVYALAGYDQTKEAVVAAFKLYVREEAREYEKEFPSQLYEQWYRLYEIPRPERNRPWKFKSLTLAHVYTPLASSNGKVLTLTRTRRSEAQTPSKKLHQFLSEVGVKALRMHLGQLLGIAQLSNSKADYERNVGKVFGSQTFWDF